MAPKATSEESNAGYQKPVNGASAVALELVSVGGNIIARTQSNGCAAKGQERVVIIDANGVRSWFRTWLHSDTSAAAGVVTFHCTLTYSTHQAFRLIRIDMARASPLQSIRARSIIRQPFSPRIVHTNTGMVGMGTAVTIAARWLYAFQRQKIKVAFFKMESYEGIP
ncbi:hypothetical protein [Nitrospira sp. Nam74]